MTGTAARLGTSVLAGLALYLCLSPVPVAAAQQPARGKTDPAADAFIREALSDYQSGRLADAVRKMRQAGRAAPSNPYPRLYLGLFLYEQDQHSGEAQSLMESAAAQFPSNPDLLLRLTDSYLASGKSGKIPALLQRGRGALESNPRLALNIVYLLVRYARLEPAREELERVAARLQKERDAAGTQAPAPESTRAWGEVLFLRGLIAATLGEKDAALGQFAAADRSDFPPQDSLQMKMLAEALFRLEEYALSAQAYKTYLQHFGSDTHARLQLAIAHYSSGAFTQSQEELMRVSREAPEMLEANYYLGLIFLENNELEDSRKRFELELKLNPRSFAAMTELAYLDFTEGDEDSCRRRLEQATALGPGWMETRFVYGLLYNRQGKYELAVKELERVVGDNPRHIKARFQLATAYSRLGKEAEARKHREMYDQLLEDRRAKSFGDRTRNK